MRTRLYSLFNIQPSNCKSIFPICGIVKQRNTRGESMDKISNILPEAGRTVEDKELERQYKIACKKFAINPKETLQDFMKQIIEESKEKDRRMSTIQFRQ